MQLFYAPGLFRGTDLFTLTEEESKHCVRVLRLGQGDCLHITDGEGNLFRVEIVRADSRRCEVRMLERTGRFEERPYRLTMAVAPTKSGDRYEWFVEKAVEIGVDAIVPLLSEHSERRAVKTERLERIAVSAMKQSLKAYLPRVEEPVSFPELVARPFAGRKLIAHCNGDDRKVSLRDAVAPGEEVLMLIGPEGDFSPAEVEEARRHGFTGVSLGRSRLRTETAAIAAVHAVAFINEV